jgi:hypothetical protein
MKILWRLQNLMGKIFSVDPPKNASIDTIDYTLESRPWMTVEVPEEYGSLALELMDRLRGNGEGKLYEKYSFLMEHRGSLIAATSFSIQDYNVEKAPELKDNLYLNVALYGAEKEGLEFMCQRIEAVLAEIEN